MTARELQKLIAGRIAAYIWTFEAPTVVQMSDWSRSI